MLGSNTIITVFIAPKDAHSYTNIKEFHTLTKRRWKTGDVLGAEEVKVINNNRKHVSGYSCALKVYGWKWGKKIEKWYTDVIGNPYHTYFKEVSKNELFWWGTSNSNRKEKSDISVPNTPMFDVSIDFDKNSLSEKIYLKGKTYDDARSTTFRGKQGLHDMISQIRTSLESDGMDKEEANKEALRQTDIYVRNLALEKNPQSKNEYRFMTNYYNKHVHETRREMMSFDVNLWFLKEILTNNLNMSLYIMSPNNELMKIQGLVGKRCKNTLMYMKSPKFVYSMSIDSKVKIKSKGFKALHTTQLKDIKIENPMYGTRSCELKKRLTSEYLYDLILDNPQSQTEWVDSFHNVFQIVDYSNIDNLNGKDIIC